MAPFDEDVAAVDVEQQLAQEGVVDSTAHDLEQSRAEAGSVGRLCVKHDQVHRDSKFLRALR